MISRQSPGMRTPAFRTWSGVAPGASAAGASAAGRAAIRRLGTVLAAVLLVVGAAMPASAHDEGPDGSDRVSVSVLADGSVYTEAPIGILSLSSCGSGNFCIWSQPNYTGSLWQYTTAGSRYSLPSSSFASYWNNRSRTSELSSTYSGVAGSYRCLPPGAKDGNLSGWAVNAHSVYLAAFQTVC